MERDIKCWNNLHRGTKVASDRQFPSDFRPRAFIHKKAPPDNLNNFAYYSLSYTNIIMFRVICIY